MKECRIDYFEKRNPCYCPMAVRFATIEEKEFGCLVTYPTGKTERYETLAIALEWLTGLLNEWFANGDIVGYQLSWEWEGR